MIDLDGSPAVIDFRFVSDGLSPPRLQVRQGHWDHDSYGYKEIHWLSWQDVRVETETTPKED